MKITYPGERVPAHVFVHGDGDRDQQRPLAVPSGSCAASPPSVLLALVLAPLATAAPKTPVFGLRAVGNPKLGYFVYSLPPGSVQQGGVIISNSGTATGTVKLFTADATTGRTTGTVYLTDRKPARAGSWISLSSTSLTLAPGQHQTVHFTVRVPASAGPGNGSAASSRRRRAR